MLNLDLKVQFFLTVQCTVDTFDRVKWTKMKGKVSKILVNWAKKNPKFNFCPPTFPMCTVPISFTNKIDDRRMSKT